jgi:hypothetical protein
LIHKQKADSKHTLDTFADNPIAYTGSGSDVFFERINETIAAVKDQMQQNLNKVIERGEKLEVLKDKAIKLEANALTFKKQAAKLNSCCRW